MNWRQFDRSDLNIFTLGRLAGLAIFVAGVILAMLDASATGRLAGSHGELRYFLTEAIGYAWKGGLLFAVAELASRFGWGGREKFDWQGVRVLRWLGMVVLVVGVGLAVWNARETQHISDSAVFRLFARNVIGALWDGAVLLVAAALLDNVARNKSEKYAPDQALV